MHDKAKQLFFITDGYPFGKGEKPFIEPELNALMDEYQVTIVSMLPEGTLVDPKWTSTLPEKVRLIRYTRASKISQFCELVGSLSSRVLRNEIKDIVKSRGTIRQVVHSMKYYSQARSIKSFFEANEIFADLENSLYYSFWMTPASLAIALEKIENPGVKLVTRAHGFDLFNNRDSAGRQPFRCFIDSMCIAVFFVSQQGKDYFDENFSTLSSHVVHRLGSKPQKLNPPRRIGEPFRIVSCSNVIPLKRVELIAEALSIAQIESLEWVHFGEGESLQLVQMIAKGINGKVQFAGQVNNSEVIDYYENNHVDAFITTSSTEGCPVSIMEAMASGIPIIATDVGAISEQIDGNGYLMSANPSKREIAECLEHFYKLSTTETELIRQRSHEIWRKRFNVELNARDTAECFRGIWQNGKLQTEQAPRRDYQEGIDGENR